MCITNVFAKRVLIVHHVGHIMLLYINNRKWTTCILP